VCKYLCQLRLTILHILALWACILHCSPSELRGNRPKDISLTPEFYFLERGTHTRIFQRTSSRPHDPAYSTAGAFLREGG
jgi:hypothetical protein